MSLDWGLVSFALSAGFIAAFNPCGFAMLPAYLSYFLGLESEDETDTGHNIMRAMTVGLTLTAGFVLFFAVIGIITQTVIDAGVIERRISYATFGFGILMVPLGIAMIRGYEPRLDIPRLNKGGKTRELPSIFMFGVSFAIVSLSCTAPIFFGTVIGSFTSDSTVDGIAVFIAYALGMSLVIMVLTLAMAIGKTTIATNMRKVLPYVNKASGFLLTVAGVFLVFYGWWEIQVVRGNIQSNWLVDTSLRGQTRIQTWAIVSGEPRLALAAGLILASAMLWATRGRLTENAQWLSFGLLAAVYGGFEILRYQGDLIVLPGVRTIVDVPGRVGNWFTDPTRWPVMFEVFAGALIVGIIWLLLRPHSSEKTPVAA
jgi:cytochrome c-type biogenesis protein